MHILQEEIGLPTYSVTPVEDDKGGAHAVFSIGPLPPGYGMTLGNSLRRVLLSSLPGAAVTSIRMKGVQHEYTTVKGVVESVMDICLNLKTLKLRKFGKEPETISLKGKGSKTLKAKDIDASSDIEILDPEQVICKLEKGGELDMEIMVEKGVGYVPAAERNKKQNEPTLIYIDSVFSPVVRVRYEIEPTRVGQQTNLEKLKIDVETNGSLTAEEAVQFASQLLKGYFEYFSSEEKIVESEFVADFSRVGAQEEEGDASPARESYTPIEILNFSPRTLNALINAGVGSIEQLTKCTGSQLSNFRGFGAKALDEVADTLKERNLSLADDNMEE
ncbi:DNA-directed RNA polymerase subunit alpha [Candidatus Peregrinibacteria bacterium]|jgi:DNA-directed RNA polymerase subunit alpha|nr:DNA-directed RNA polymerase subunit alpha [Candidatus Peregrinibacteria bacterium]MBT3599097.1 DNA-directed RNA polymerase subunit alpha [Candidatus Peregrinibacteria bacterium]MBT4367668.1 DNA-directed RNA polymerase subunit alpha [Candidatus Peregrinibacteria bacterium]MBT4585446.1 DNA-directed RNA polymerase subunit alpha [Candidatus Peregrinibacteria bacterium]MBT6730403.1 DNA-directed RNA polymerase subunit alpha [Candidatus Peregrinibacteria bacterium]